MIPILLLCLCTIATQNYQVYGWFPNLSKNEDLELEKQLKIINKPPIKTIQTNYGRIVDCIDIYKQLAFDNPLLKNHKIQLKPSFEDTLVQIQTNDSFRYFNIGLENDSCPKGSVPVQRTTKEDLVRASQLPNNFGIFTKNEPGAHVCCLYKFIVD
ncbi:protein neprosin-like [Cicer arietinum]|uniref:Uncharacterized protein LOC105852617 n=1 Tax=Cicer arietinum TaxID=3827 RepID=A0A3Q7Y423_CICAR|nr:uncharacterized protein LOC105852617 [Cicer arietinum]